MNQNRIAVFELKKNNFVVFTKFSVSLLADLGGRGSISFIFKQSVGKLGQIRGWCPHLSGCGPVWEILDLRLIMKKSKSGSYQSYYQSGSIQFQQW